jgi:hypothetical protein
MQNVKTPDLRFGLERETAPVLRMTCNLAIQEGASFSKEPRVD